MMNKLEYPTLVTCKHCDQIVYYCVCCFVNDDLSTCRLGTLVDGWKFDHDNCVEGKEHEAKEA